MPMVTEGGAKCWRGPMPTQREPGRGMSTLTCSTLVRLQSTHPRARTCSASTWTRSMEREKLEDLSLHGGRRLLRAHSRVKRGLATGAVGDCAVATAANCVSLEEAAGAVANGARP